MVSRDRKHANCGDSVAVFMFMFIFTFMFLTTCPQAAAVNVASPNLTPKVLSIRSPALSITKLSMMPGTESVQRTRTPCATNRKRCRNVYEVYTNVDQLTTAQI